MSTSRLPFDEGPPFDESLPNGFRYEPGFVSADEEALVVSAVERVEFSNFEMRGVIARRRVAFFGASYDNRDRPSRPFPEFLTALAAKAAAWASIDPAAIAMALINEYQPGAPIGWHRDAPQYDIVIGISLVSPCRMKFRPYVSPATPRPAAGRAPRRTTHEIDLEPRSIYLIDGAARQAFEHSIPAVAALRYSVTFRTLRP
jgi:alkylated DNA repair dioxygenase AlkB